MNPDNLDDRHSPRRPRIGTVLAAAWLLLAPGCGRTATNAPVPAALPDDAVARNDAAVGLMGRYDFDAAATRFADLAGAYPGSPDVQVNLAVATMNRQREGDETAARRLLEQVLRVHPADVRAHYVLGLLLLNGGEAAAAAPHFRLVAERVPDDGHAAYYVGQCALQTGDAADAERWFARAATIAPRLRSAYYGRYLALQRLGRGTEAEPLLATFRDLDADPRAETAEFKYTRMGPLAEAATIERTATRATPVPAGPVFAEAAARVPVGGGWTSPAGSVAASVTLADIDGDGTPDLFVASGGARNAVLLTRGHRFEPQPDHPLAAISGVNAALWGDLDGDGRTDVYLCRRAGNQTWRHGADGDWHDVTVATRTRGPAESTDGAILDADHDGDLDLLLVTAGGRIELLNNDGNGAFHAIGTSAGLGENTRPVLGIAVADLDADRDTDIVILRQEPPHDVFLNDRTWRYHQADGFDAFRRASARAILAGDRDADGIPELYVSGPAGLVRWSRGADRRWSAATVSADLRLAGAARLAIADVDGDGAPDLLGSVADGWAVVDGDTGQVRATRTSPGLAAWAVAVLESRHGPAVVGVDSQGPLVWHPGPGRLPFVTLAFTGRDSHSDQIRSNVSGIGARAALRAGGRWTSLDTLRSQSGPGQSLQPVAVGLGGAARADFVAITWSDGVYQTEVGLQPGAVHRIAETQRQLSSCPVLFVYDGHDYAFVTDLMGVGGMGTPERPGVIGEPDPDEHVLVPADRLVADGGRFKLKITEPMEEAAYIDAVALAVYDLPPGWRMTLDERKGVSAPAPTGEPRFYRAERLPIRATNDRGQDVTAAVRAGDGVAAPPPASDPRFIGLTPEHAVTLTFDAPLDGPSPMLVADGWIEYPYAQTIFAMWQARADYRVPSLDVQEASGRWRPQLREFGYPAGMPRQMSVPLDRLPAGTRAIRLRTSQEIYWDRLAIGYAEAAPGVTSRTLPLAAAHVAVTGFPRRTTGPQRRPSYDYRQRVPLWDTRHQAGFYTREGPAADLVRAADGALAIIGPGEELHLEFAAPADTPPPGWTRHFVLQARGWCKDMDMYTDHGDTIAPLPVEPTGAARRLHAQYNTRYAAGR